MVDPDSLEAYVTWQIILLNKNLTVTKVTVFWCFQEDFLMFLGGR